MFLLFVKTVKSMLKIKDCYTMLLEWDKEKNMNMLQSK